MKLRNIYSLIGNIVTFLIAGLSFFAILVNYLNNINLNFFLSLPIITFILYTLVSLIGIICDSYAIKKNILIKSNIYVSFKLLVVVFLFVGSLLWINQYSYNNLGVNIAYIVQIFLTVYSIISFIFLDFSFIGKNSIIITPFIFTVLYFGVNYLLFFLKVLPYFPYHFMNFFKDNKFSLENFVILIIFVCLPAAIGSLLFFAAGYIRKCFPLKASPLKAKKKKKSKKKKKIKKAKNKKRKIKIPKHISIEIPNDLDLSYSIYHVTKRFDVDYWQVKYGKDVKCIKLFRTKDEAIEYANILASVTDASIRVHAENGKIDKTH